MSVQVIRPVGPEAYYLEIYDVEDERTPILAGRSRLPYMTFSAGDTVDLSASVPGGGPYTPLWTVERVEHIVWASTEEDVLKHKIMVFCRSGRTESS